MKQYQKQFTQFEQQNVFNLLSESSMTYEFTFKTMNMRDKYALIAAQYRQFAMNSALLREESAHLRISDCFECLSPHSIAA